MLSFTTELYSRMQSGLQEINGKKDTGIKKAEEAYRLCCSCLQELKDFIGSYSFTGLEEEVRFFKEVKPRFLKEMLFYLKLLQIESYKPPGNPMKEYYQAQIALVHDYIARNQDLYIYMKLGKDDLDNKMFLREPELSPLLPHYTLEYDSSFSNPFSFKLAKLQAWEDLAQELNFILQSGDYQLLDGRSFTQGPPALFWKGTQAQFYEVVLAFVKTGVLGEVTVKAAMEWLGHCLQVSPGHYYRYIQAMRIRKKSRVPYLNKCIRAVEEYMDDCDEHPKYH